MTTSNGQFGQEQPTLVIIIASVRDGRVGKAVGEWFEQVVNDHGWFDVTVADLKEIDLPLMTEPNHPRMKQYTQRKTWEWSALVDAADAFVFVMPEYNYSATAPLINAIDYLVQEWAYKPVGLVSYGGVSGGMRAAQSIKPLITSMNMMPLKEGVTIQSVATQINQDTGTFEPNTDSITSSAGAMLNALVQWEKAMHQLRVPVGAAD
jgi:NAD(P)H-dependent FMN reductase